MLPPELSALAEAGYPLEDLRAAATSAAANGAHPFDALLASADNPGSAVEALARQLQFDVCQASNHCGSPIDADAFSNAMRTGVLGDVDADGSLRLIVAARGASVASLAQACEAGTPPSGVALATPQAFADIAVARAGSALAVRASEGPARRFPELTVAHGLPRAGASLLLSALVAAVFMLAACTTEIGWTLATLSIGLVFLILNVLRLRLACCPDIADPPFDPIPDDGLPTYSILVPLAREGDAVVAGLLDALEAMDYPAAKIDLKLLVELGDAETLAALAARPPRGGAEILVLPPGGPKTKPRALNAGLLAARGAYLTIYDAEDRPDPQQLRLAVAAFRNGPAKVACVQARLAIDNAADGWIARQFAIEYAALFDVLIPALAALRLPIPLGGTSNHFRVAALKAVGGWDAGNVTEDADLGFRLARLGWTTGALRSTTWEEAPIRIMPWVRQRTRWMKGYMITAAVHACNPGALNRRLGPTGFVASLTLVGGVAFTALAYPVALAMILAQALTGSLLAPTTSLAEALLLAFHVANFVIGFSAALGCACIGIDRRRPGALARDFMIMPVYWALIGFAAWRAVGQIATAQAMVWEKTRHGVSRRRKEGRQM